MSNNDKISLINNLNLYNNDKICKESRNDYEIVENDTSLWKNGIEVNNNDTILCNNDGEYKELINYIEIRGNDTSFGEMT